MSVNECDRLLKEWGFDCFMHSDSKRCYHRKANRPIIEVYPETENFRISYTPIGKRSVLSTEIMSPVSNKRYVMETYKAIVREGKAIDSIYMLGEMFSEKGYLWN